jgi:hypothetical protein
MLYPETSSNPCHQQQNIIIKKVFKANPYSDMNGKLFTQMAKFHSIWSPTLLKWVPWTRKNNVIKTIDINHFVTIGT